jgi:hypothetical protein
MGGGVLASDLGEVCDSVFRQLNQCDPALNSSGMSLWSLINTPGDGLQSVITDQNAVKTGLCPCVLADIYIRQTCKIAVLEFMSFVTTSKKQIGLEMVPDGSVFSFDNDAYSVPYMKIETAPGIDTSDVPTRHARTTYNLRLAATAYDTSTYNSRGLNQISQLDPGQIAMRKFVPRDALVPFNSLWNVDILGMCSLVYPHFDSSGRRLYLVVEAANGASSMTRTMAGAEYVSVPAWVKPNTAIKSLYLVTSNSTQKDKLRGRKMGNGSGPSGGGLEETP